MTVFCPSAVAWSSFGILANIYQGISCRESRLSCRKRDNLQKVIMQGWARIILSDLFMLLPSLRICMFAVCALSGLPSNIAFVCPELSVCASLMDRPALLQLRWPSLYCGVGFSRCHGVCFPIRLSGAGFSTTITSSFGGHS